MKKYRMLLGTIKAKLWYFKGNFENFLWFQLRSWRNLTGKETIVMSRNVYSKGGYKYLQLDLTLVPLNKVKTINE